MRCSSDTQGATQLNIALGTLWPSSYNHPQPRNVMTFSQRREQLISILQEALDIISDMDDDSDSLSAATVSEEVSSSDSSRGGVSRHLS